MKNLGYSKVLPNNYGPKKPKTPKGGLIWKSFPLWLKSKMKGTKSLSWAQSTYREDARERNLAPYFWDLSQIEKLSEIKPPLSIQYELPDGVNWPTIVSGFVFSSMVWTRLKLWTFFISNFVWITFRLSLRLWFFISGFFTLPCWTVSLIFSNNSATPLCSERPKLHFSQSAEAEQSQKLGPLNVA